MKSLTKSQQTFHDWNKSRKAFGKYFEFVVAMKMASCWLWWWGCGVGVGMGKIGIDSNRKIKYNVKVVGDGRKMIDIRKIGVGESIHLAEKIVICVPAKFGVGDEVNIDIDIDARLINTGKSFLLEGKGECRLWMECSLCLTVHNVDINFPITENFAQENPADDDIFFSDKIIDIRPALERNLFVNIPMKPLCMPDCAGLCLKCGKNLNDTGCICECPGEINEQFRDLLQMFNDKEV